MRGLAAVLVLGLVITPASGCGRLGSRLDRDGLDVRARGRCMADGWREEATPVAGIERRLLWKGPATWRNGAIVVLHGGGGTASDFCSGGRLVRPQIEFARLAIARGFAVFALDATNDRVTDAEGRVCGKRFDFMVLDRPNLDLPFLEEVVERIVPGQRPAASSEAIFLTGLSTGGYMTIRAATPLGDRITAFAPIAAGDPYRTRASCDASLSPRKSAKGVLLDAETGSQITEPGACRASRSAGDAAGLRGTPGPKAPFRQFHDRGDGIVDLTCMEKARATLDGLGHPDRGASLFGSSAKRSVWRHLWQTEYNAPLLDFMERER